MCPKTFGWKTWPNAGIFLVINIRNICQSKGVEECRSKVLSCRANWSNYRISFQGSIENRIRRLIKINMGHVMVEGAQHEGKG